MKLQMETRQTQQLKMTPLLQQSIHLLQLSSFELKEYIEKEALENPWIDLKDASFSSSGESMHEFAPFHKRNEQPDLHEYLVQQLAFAPFPEDEKRMVHRFIFHLNENGYMEDSQDVLAEEYGISTESAARCMSHLQSLEPHGVGAHSLKECLLLQAERFFPEETSLAVLIKDHLQDVADQNEEFLCTALGVAPSELSKCIELLRSLHPKPGLTIGTSRADVLVPDVFIKEEEGSYSISLNNQIVPTLQLNQEYRQMMKEHKEAASFLEEKYKTFLWLQKSIEQRQWTILAITEELLRRQPTLMTEGIRSLHSLTRKEVANEIGVHESTVSRAVRNKIVETPSGSFYMEELFPSRTTTGSSSSVIKHHIHTFVTNEDPERPLSDQKLVQLLTQEGLHASRRTIAKYRDALNIPASSKRKKIPLLNR